MKKRICAFLSALVMITVSFSGCLGDKGLNKDLYFPIYADPVSFDPQIASDQASKIIVANCFEGLVRYNGEGRLIPGAAKSWEISADGLTYTFHLREDAKWYISEYAMELLNEEEAGAFNDSVTADDFVFGLRRAFDPEMQAVTDSRLFVIDGANDVAEGKAPLSALNVTARDSKTLVIVLTTASDGFLEALTQSAAMPCREEFFLATKGKYGLDSESVMFNGPFYLYSWSEGSNLNLSRNEKYAGEAQVCPSNVYLYINDDERTRVTKITEGVYDACPLTSQQKETITNENITYVGYQNTVWALHFNTDRETIANEKIRLGLCRATNRDVLALPDYSSTKAQGLIPAIAKAGTEQYRELAGNINPLPFDADDARTLWKAGLKSLDTGILDITVLCPAEFDSMMRKLVQTWQESLGISLGVIIKSEDTEAYNQDLSAGNYDVALQKIVCSNESAASFLKQFSSANGDSALNLLSGRYDDLADKAMYATKQAAIVSNCREAEQMLLGTGELYPLFYEDSYAALAKNVSGIFCIEAGTIPVFIDGKRVG